jgi:hypothetical protein
MACQEWVMPLAGSYTSNQPNSVSMDIGDIHDMMFGCFLLMSSRLRSALSNIGESSKENEEARSLRPIIFEGHSKSSIASTFDTC